MCGMQLRQCLEGNLWLLMNTVEKRNGENQYSKLSYYETRRRANETQTQIKKKQIIKNTVFDEIESIYTIEKSSQPKFFL